MASAARWSSIRMQKLFTLGFVALLTAAGFAVLPTVAAAPAISGVTPTSGTTNGGTEITISGSDFATSAIVELATGFPSGPGTSAIRAHVTSWSPTQITAITPPHATAETVAIRVINPNGQAASFTGLFTFVSAPNPVVTSVSPNQGSSNGGQTVEVLGSGFAVGSNPPLVEFNGLDAVVLSVTATKIVALTPASAPAAALVQVTNPDGKADLDSDGAGTADVVGCGNCFAWTDATRPSVTSLNPSQGVVTGGMPVTITGSNFAAGAQVVFDPDATCADISNGVLAPSVSFTSSTQLVAIAPAQDLIAGPSTGTAPKVCVVNPDTKANNNPPSFSYTPVAGSQDADLVSASPAKGPSYGGTFVNLQGSNFHMGSNEKPTVTILAGSGCASAVEFVFDPTDVVVQTPSTILVRMPSTHGTGGGPRAITVTNPNGATDCVPGAFNFVVPVEITDITPKTGPSTGGIGTTTALSNDPVVISGRGFNPTGGLRVFFGAVEAKVTAQSTTSVSAIPPPQAASSGGVQVVVVNNDGKAAAFWKYTYFQGPTPTIDHLNNAGSSSPTAVGSNNGGGRLTINAGSTSPRFAFGHDPDGAGPLEPAIPTVTVGNVPVIVMKTEPADGTYPLGTEQCDLTPDGVADRCKYPAGLVSSFTVLIPPHATAWTSAVDVKVTNPDGRSDQSADANERVTSSNADDPVFGQMETFGDAGRGPTWGGTPVLLDGTPAALDNFLTEAPTLYFGDQATNLDAAKPTVKVGNIAVPPNQVFVIADGATALPDPDDTGPLTALTCDVGPCILFYTPAFTSGAGALDQVIMVTNPNGDTVTGPASEGFDYDFQGTNGLQATPGPSFGSFGTGTPASGPSNGGNLVRIVGTNLAQVTVDGSASHLPCDTTPDDAATCDAGFDGHRIATPLPQVFFDGVAGTQVRVVGSGSTGTSIYVRVPPHAATAPNGVPVIIRNPDGQTDAAGTYIYEDTSPLPSISALRTGPSPTDPILATSSFIGGARVYLHGTNFPTATLDADDKGCTANRAVDIAGGFDPTQIVTPRPTLTIGAVPALDVCIFDPDGAGANPPVIGAIVPAHATGDAVVTLVNPDGDSISVGGSFSYLPALPVPTGLSIATAPGNGGVGATISGANFASTHQAYFTDQAATTSRYMPALMGSTSGGSSAVALPPSPYTGDGAGVADVKVADAEGQMGTLDAPVTYQASALPQYRAVAPMVGSVNGGTTITIDGAGFAPGAAVRFDNDVSDANDAPLRGVSVSSDGKRLTFVTPNFMKTTGRNFGPIDLLVCNPIAGLTPGAAASTTTCAMGNPNALFIPDAFGFAAIAAPTVATVTPGNGPTAGGTTVTITGTGFFANPAVKFDNVEATDVTVLSATQLTAKTPPHASGPVSVSVTVGGQAGALANGFIYDGASSTTETTTSTSTVTTTTGTTTTPPATTGPLPTTGAPTVPTAAEIEAANKKIELTVTRDGTSNVLEWDLPPASQLPLPVAGVQVHASNSPYALVDTFPAGSDEFEDGTFTHTGDAARASTKYLVTMYYGSTAALGFFSGSNAPDTTDYPGLASTDEQPSSGDGDGLPTWVIVLIVLGILFLVVLVAVLIARGRQGDQETATTQQTYASWEEPSAGPQAGAGGEVHQARCPACATSFTVTGTKPVITVCPGCGKKGILR